MRSLLLACVLALAGCHRATAAMDAAAIKASAAALAEDTDFGAATMLVKPDGSFHALLEGKDGQPAKEVSGTVTYTADGKTTTAPVTSDGKGVITATGPKLEADVTDVTYALAVDGKPYAGTLHVPQSGTEDIAATAKLQTAAKTGPHGGTIQIIGDDRVEVVAENGEVKAWVLGADDKPVDLGDRKITIAIDDESPQVIVLAPEPEGHFAVAKIGLKGDPARITIFVKRGGVVHAHIVGHGPGTHLMVVGPKSPRVKLFVAGVDSPHVDVKGHDDTKLKIDIKDKGHGGNVKIKIH